MGDPFDNGIVMLLVLLLLLVPLALPVDVPEAVAVLVAATAALSTKNPTNKNRSPLVIFCPQWRNLPGNIRA